jgi:hypothetical protein
LINYDAVRQFDPSRDAQKAQIDKAYATKDKEPEEKWRPQVWRYYFHPKLMHKIEMSFPVALIVKKDGVDCGEVVMAKIELLTYGATGVQGPHPLHDLYSEGFAPPLQVASSATAVASESTMSAVDKFKTSIANAWYSARSLEGSNQNLDAAYYVPVTGGVGGDSVGGAFALAFARALQGRLYDPLVIVIAAVGSRKGDLQPVAYGPGNENLRLKVQGIAAFNQSVSDDRRIDTIAVVSAKQKEAVKLELERLVDQGPHIPRVIAIEDLA